MVQENQTAQENKMGVMPVNRLLITMSLPMMISMLVQALYNIVDSIFVSQINEYALRAVSLAFPVQSLMIAVAVGTAVGINAFLSKTLGEKNFEKANVIAVNGIFLAAVSFVLFVLVGLFVSAPFFASQTDIAQVREYGVTYLTICCCMSIGIFMQTTFERLLQATGKTFHTMITQGVGAVINLILDPILIFGMFGLPEMGVAGAALATVTGQIVAAILAIIFNLKFNRELKLSFKGFRPDFALIGQIYKVGAPSIVVQSVGSVMTYGMNLILEAFGAAQTVFGVYFKLQSFVFMPVFGLNNGMVPIIAYNYGAGRKDRVINTIRSSVMFGVGIMLVGLVVMELFPGQLISLFNATDELLVIGVPAMRTICLSFVFAGFCVVAGSVFQALGNGVYSMIVSVARQLCVLLPVAKLLSLSGDVNLIWWAFPIAELCSVGLSAVFLVRIYRKIIRHIGERTAGGAV
ncbi:MAG: MATE family efflux transporter [Clostridium sp.]|nr:MATE family efflux transporter [Acetatifactor muris]MCM1527767.1 MATE family efflux transporter [Bacteroides sp.]MCM1563703.1 MATE family efflux transporter [Clostridium sp.]